VSSVEGLIVEHEGAVLRLVIDRPDAGNSITPEVRKGIIGALDAAGPDAAVRAVLLTATGDRHFCTGADLRGTGGGGEPKPGDIAAVIREGIQRLCAAILDCPKPVVVGLNGTAAGGGAMMTLAADLVVASDTARVIQVFVRRGLIPDGGVAWMLPRLVGLHKAKELVYFGGDLSAADAERLGIVNAVVPPSELAATANEWAARLATGPTTALGFAKRLLNRALDTDRDAWFAEEAELVEANQQTADSKEGIASFMERRPPEFTGQ
jgi:2-(1,2-epoxy-1,2-dihydrophenyl)acetyl-CoA isomerase